MRNAILRYSALLLALCFMLIGSVAADDNYSPTWRRAVGTTFQKWTFDTSTNRPAPSVVNNPYGTASATINVGTTGGWVSSNAAYGSRTGYWSLGPSAVVQISLPNQIEANKAEDVWVQLVWAYVLDDQGQSGAPKAVSVDGCSASTTQATALESNAKTGWFDTVYKFQLNPAVANRQTITITADSVRGFLLDQVIIDTRLTSIVPEPSSLLTMLAGGVALAVSRRKRR